MELALGNGFCELTMDDMEMVDGGASASGVFVGTLLVSWAPVGACFNPVVGAGMALIGAGIIGKSTGAY